GLKNSIAPSRSLTVIPTWHIAPSSGITDRCLRGPVLTTSYGGETKSPASATGRRGGNPPSDGSRKASAARDALEEAHARAQRPLIVLNHHRGRCGRR